MICQNAESLKIFMINDKKYMLEAFNNNFYELLLLRVILIVLTIDHPYIIKVIGYSFISNGFCSV